MDLSLNPDFLLISFLFDLGQNTEPLSPFSHLLNGVDETDVIGCGEE